MLYSINISEDLSPQYVDLYIVTFRWHF